MQECVQIRITSRKLKEIVLKNLTDVNDEVHRANCVYGVISWVSHVVYAQFSLLGSSSYFGTVAHQRRWWFIVVHALYVTPLQMNGISQQTPGATVKGLPSHPLFSFARKDRQKNVDILLSHLLLTWITVLQMQEVCLLASRMRNYPAILSEYVTVVSGSAHRNKPSFSFYIVARDKFLSGTCFESQARAHPFPTRSMVADFQPRPKWRGQRPTEEGEI